MNIKLYNYTGDKIVVNKTGWLTVATLYASLDGYLKEDTDLMDPSIVIENSGIPAANYAYIADLGRYYFINNIVCLGATLWRLDMHVDVLMTYAGTKNGSSSTGIFGLSCYVERYVASDSDYLIENAYPLKGSATIASVTGANTTWKGSSSFLDSTDTTARYLMLFNGKEELNGVTLESPYIIPHIVTKCSNMVTIMTDICSAINFANPLVNYIAGIQCLPCAINTGTTAVDTIDFPGINTPISVTSCGLAQERIKNVSWSMTVNAVSTTNKWKNFTPYTSVMLTFLPFGRFALDTSLLFASGSNASVTVYVHYDIVSGNAILTYKAGTSAEIYLGSANVAIQCPYAANNYSAAKVASSAVSFGVGLASLAAGNVVGGIAGTANGIINAASAFDPSASSQSAGGYTFIDNAPRIDTIFHDIEGTAATLIGKPYCATAMLGTLSGFTKVGRVHVSNLPGTPTAAEIDEVEQLLLSGVEL